MFILDIKDGIKEKQIRKEMFGYLLIAIGLIIINKIYAQFSHGVSSDYMTCMFLYPLISGTILFTLLEILVPKVNRFKGYRLFFNIYNSGIALLVIGSFLKGIFEIAGTNSDYLKYYFYTGSGLLAMGLMILVMLVANYKKVKSVL